MLWSAMLAPVIPKKVSVMPLRPFWNKANGWPEMVQNQASVGRKEWLGDGWAYQLLLPMVVRDTFLGSKSRTWDAFPLLHSHSPLLEFYHIRKCTNASVHPTHRLSHDSLSLLTKSVRDISTICALIAWHPRGHCHQQLLHYLNS